MKGILLAILCALIFMSCSTQTVITYRMIDVTENPIGTKVGQVDQTKGGILEAAQNGGITRISTVSKQNTDKYITYYWTILLGQGANTVNTMHLEEIIVTGE